MFLAIKISNDNSSSYDNEMFKTTVDLCKISDGVLGSFAMRWYLETFEKSANFEYKCPFVKVYMSRYLNILN